MTRRTRRAQVMAGVRAVHQEAAGMIRLDVVMPREVLGLLAATAHGDERAATLTHLVEQVWSQVKAAPPHQPVLCAACPMPVRDHVGGFVLVTGLVDSPAHGLGFCVCRSCGPTPEAVEAKGAEAAKRFWPDFRPVPAPVAGGRA